MVIFLQLNVSHAAVCITDNVSCQCVATATGVDLQKKVDRIPNLLPLPPFPSSPLISRPLNPARGFGGSL